MAAIAATWSKRVIAGRTPIMVHGVGSGIDGDGLPDPSVDPDVLQGKLDLLQVSAIDAILVYS